MNCFQKLNKSIATIFLFFSYVLLLLFIPTKSAFALTFELPSNGDNVVGRVQVVQSLPGDDFSKLGRRYDVGYYQLVEANPGVDPKLPQAGTVVVVPTRFILPAAPRSGVVINLAELRLYYFPPNSRKVITYPIGIGREGWMTPVGTTHISEKTVNPTWTVPDSIRVWRAEQGVTLPKSIPPGPDNPLGGYRMRLGKPTYLIHGTNDASGVGRRSSSGCIRMLPEDVENLFSLVPVGTIVTIVNDPYKAGLLGGMLYLEAHLPLQEQLQTQAVKLTTMASIVMGEIKHRPYKIDWKAAKKVANVQNGVLQAIGTSFNSPSYARQDFAPVSEDIPIY